MDIDLPVPDAGATNPLVIFDDYERWDVNLEWREPSVPASPVEFVYTMLGFRLRRGYERAHVLACRGRPVEVFQPDHLVGGRVGTLHTIEFGFEVRATLLEGLDQFDVGRITPGLLSQTGWGDADDDVTVTVLACGLEALCRKTRWLL